jgi:putative oxidoreductase
MRALEIIGRFLFALPFAIFGLNHFMHSQNMRTLVPPVFPGEAIWVYITGTALILAAVSIGLRKYIRQACTLLGIMLLIFVICVHAPGLTDEATMMMSMAGMLKDTALAGAAFYIASTDDKLPRS